MLVLCPHCKGTHDVGPQEVPSQKGLTARQQELLRFIQGYVVEHKGVPPSYEEMTFGIGVASKSGISRLVNGLEERGFVRRLPNRWRSVMPVGFERYQHEAA